MKVQLQVHVKGYTNVHDGYCSDNECSYEEIDEYRHFIADIDPEVVPVLNNNMFRKELEEIVDSYTPYKCRNGSGFCINDSRADKLGVEQHDIEIELSDVEIDLCLSEP